MSEINEIHKKIAKLETQMGISAKFNIPMQEFVRPEIISFYGSVSNVGVIVQPTQFFTVNPDRFLFIRRIDAIIAPDNDNGVNAYRIRFNLIDSGRNYNFFNSDISIGLFSSANNKDANDVVGVLVKQNAVIRCSLSISANPSNDTNVGIFLVGDLIDPSYLQHYFAKNMWRK